MLGGFVGTSNKHINMYRWSEDHKTQCTYCNEVRNGFQAVLKSI